MADAEREGFSTRSSKEQAWVANVRTHLAWKVDLDGLDADILRTRRHAG